MLSFSLHASLPKGEHHQPMCSGTGRLDQCAARCTARQKTDRDTRALEQPIQGWTCFNCRRGTRPHFEHTLDALSLLDREQVPAATRHVYWAKHRKPSASQEQHEQPKVRPPGASFTGRDVVAVTVEHRTSKRRMQQATVKFQKNTGQHSDPWARQCH